MSSFESMSITLNYYHYFQVLSSAVSLAKVGQMVIYSDHMWAEVREAYRKIFDYWYGNPDREQTDNLRLGIFQSRPRKFLGLA